ncbi:MAG: hypothetical protein ACFFAY_10575, partial [Promethearchaeota archaeon]
IKLMSGRYPGFDDIHNTAIHEAILFTSNIIGMLIEPPGPDIALDVLLVLGIAIEVVVISYIMIRRTYRKQA